jgi:pimeloyl-ACP methyl ester carboxylesterase
MNKKRLKFGFLIVLLIGLLLYITFYDSCPVGHFNSVEGERAYKESYAKAMELLPEPTKIYNIQTRFGVVRIYQFANTAHPDRTPVFLFPGRTSGTPMWSENIIDLVAERTVYSLDALGDAGLSIQTNPIKNSADQSLWIEETLDSLDLNNINVVGHSFGGWLAANYAVRYPSRVKTLSLLEPVFVLQGLKMEIYVNSIAASLKFLPQSWRDTMLENIGGSDSIDKSDPIYQMIANATQHYSLKLPLPDQMTNGQLQSLSMPVYVALGEKSVMHDSYKAVTVAKSNIKDVSIKNWKDGSHSLPMEFANQINSELLLFMNNHESSLLQPSTRKIN